MSISSVGWTEDSDESKSFKWRKKRSWGRGKDSLCLSALFSYLHFSKVFLRFYLSLSFGTHSFFFFPFTWVWGFCIIYETAISPDLETLVLHRRLNLLVQTCPSFGLFPKPLGLSKQPCLFLVVPSGGDCAETYQCLPGWQGTLVST